MPRPLIDPSNMRLSPTSGSHSSQSSLYDFFGAERCKTVPYACNQSERHCILPTTLVGFERSITPCGMSFCSAGACPQPYPSQRKALKAISRALKNTDPITTFCLVFLKKITIPGERGGYALPAVARKIDATKATTGGLHKHIPPPVGAGLSEIPGDMWVLRESVSLGKAIDPQNCWINEKKCYNTPRACS